MSITKPILLDETGRLMLSALNRQNAILEIMASDKIEELTTNLEEIHRLVREGIAQEVLSVGDQINVPWSDGANNYTMPFDIVHFGNVTLQDGEVVPGMYLQAHYCLPDGIQFDNAEAFYVVPDGGLAAGTYNVTLAQTWSKALAGTYQFTLTQPVPAGGRLAGFVQMPDKDPGAWKVISYASQTATAAIETVSVSTGNEGTSLGTMAYTMPGDLNCMQRVGYGYNRWSQSGIRQYLNSKEAAGAWWKPQNEFDLAPEQLATKQGFMKGFGDDFLNCIGKVKVTTALNTVEGHAADREDTYDKFFLPSLEQMYINPQLAGAEGEYWEYWKRALGRTSPAQQYQTYEELKTYALNAKTSPQDVRLRSAIRGFATNAWYVNSSGYVHSNYAWYAYRCAPACVMC